MARRYARDNRGRFASSGSGATARGGRLKTASGNKRETQTMQASAAPKGTIGKPRGLKPQSAKPAPSAAANPAATTGARLGGTRRTTRAAAPASTVANKTGQSKTLNRFNSRPVGTKILNSKNQLVPSATRVPLRVAGKGSNESDRAFGRVATKTARRRAAAAKPAAKSAAATKSVTSKVDTSAAAIARRRSRAMAERTSVAGGQFNMKLNTRSQITRSAANEIYNRQRQIAKASGGRIDQSVARQAIGALPGLSGTKRQRAEQLREKARRRVVGGRRR